jgi:NitT/TauT family transport system substrate-binding protein
VKLTTRRLSVLLGAAALVAVTGCSGGDTAEATPETPAELEKVSIGNFGNSTLTMPYVIAQEQGFFRDAGLDVQTVVAPSGPELAAGLIGGTTQIATGTPQNIIPAMQQGQKLAAIPSFGRLDLSLVVPTNSAVKDVKSLKGKRVGVTARGSASEKFARTMLQDHGVDPESVTYVAVGPLPAQIAAFSNDAIDASVFSSDATVFSGVNGVKVRTLVDSMKGTAGELGDYGLQSFWVTTKDFGDQHPTIVDGFCQAMNKASTWLADDANRDAAVASITKLTGLPKASASEIWDLQHTSWLPQIDEERWSANVEWILGNADEVPFDDHVVSDCG